MVIVVSVPSMTVTFHRRGEGMPNEMIADLLGNTSTRMVGDQ
jgi:hypothetical protein